MRGGRMFVPVFMLQKITVLCQRQRNLKSRTTARGIQYRDCSFMKWNDLIRNTQSQTKMLPVISGRICPVKTPENKSLGRIRNTGSVVFDADKKVRFGLWKGKNNFPVFGDITDGIVKKDSKHLTDPFRVTGTGRDFLFRKFNEKFHMVVLHQGFILFVGIQK